VVAPEAKSLRGRRCTSCSPEAPRAVRDAEVSLVLADPNERGAVLQEPDQARSVDAQSFSGAFVVPSPEQDQPKRCACTVQAHYLRRCAGRAIRAVVQRGYALTLPLPPQGMRLRLGFPASGRTERRRCRVCAL